MKPVLTKALHILNKMLHILHKNTLSRIKTAMGSWVHMPPPKYKLCLARMDVQRQNVGPEITGGVLTSLHCVLK
jgi:hypothetical protein